MFRVRWEFRLREPLPACVRLYVISRKYMEYYVRKVNGLVILVAAMTDFLVLAHVAVKASAEPRCRLLLHL
jgi:hypothetical protein